MQRSLNLIGPTEMPNTNHFGGQFKIILPLMRHGCRFRKLSREPQKRLRLLRNLATGLFEHEHIKTTLARAKELRRFAEKIITLGKRETQESRLKVFEHLSKPAIGTKVLTELKERYKDRHGGYTRIWNAGNRPQDCAPIAIIEMVDNPFDMRKAFSQKIKSSGSQ